jgi:HEAT repeat protein
VTRQIWPKAFRAVAVNNSLIELHWEDYLAAVQGGDVMLYPAWYDASENEAVRLFYREAELRRSMKLESADAPELATLVADAKDSSEEVRLRAATLLQTSTSPQAAETLVRLVEDPSPIVQRQALRSIAATDTPQAKETMLALANWISTRKNNPLQNAFRPFAADALAKAGEPALPIVLDMLAGKEANAWPYALRTLGGIGVNNEQVARALQSFLDAPAGDPRLAHRLAAIDVAGQVRCRRSYGCWRRRAATPRNSAADRSKHSAASAIPRPSSR